MNRLFTSESVTEGHPDKLCDQVSDAVLDAALKEDPTSRVACETAASTGFALVMGEITTKAQLDIEAIARKTISRIGFVDEAMGFDANKCEVIVRMDAQSTDIAMGVDKSMESKQGGILEVGAGDQGMMFGFACNQTKEYMPMPISLAHQLSHKLSEVRRGGIDFLYPDGKSQVTVEYDGYKPVRIDAVVVSTQHSADVSQKEIHEAVMETVIKPVIPANMLDANTKYFINPTGRFVIGGPNGDSGLTGRKIIVDTYGGYSRHGGGAFSGKDPTKVDRSAAYACRYVAKNIVAAGLADMCEIEVAYAIGVAQPVSIFVETFGTGKVSEDRLIEIVKRNFDFRPQAIIEKLDLRRPIYEQVAAYGHMGRIDLDLPWERTDLAAILQGEL